MRNAWVWLLVAIVTLGGTAGPAARANFPAVPPALRPPAAADRVIRLNVEYDQLFAKLHGDRVEVVVLEAIAIHNTEWRQYRREWFELGGLTFRASGGERDAAYVLANFLHRTVAAPDTIHVLVTGRPLEVYGGGRTPIGGLAFRGSDAILVSAGSGIGSEMLAYYLFHEIGHTFDAYDIPFGGGDTTFGSKSRITFEIDAGNEELIAGSRGPRPRDARHRAPMVLREKLARGRAVARETKLYAPLHDLLLHDPSPSNPAYVAKKRKLLASAGEQAPEIAALLAGYEPTREQLADDREVREQIAGHYWRANDAIRRRDYDTAGAELQAIRALAESSPDVRMLVGAAAKKVRKRR